MDETSTPKPGLNRLGQEDRIVSPEKLNEYIRVARPSAWLLLLALGAILVVFFIWGFTGSIPVNKAIKGVAMSAGVSGDTVNEDTTVNNVLCLVSGENTMGGTLQGKDASVVFRDGTRVKGKSIIADTSMLTDKEVSSLLEEYQINYHTVLSALGAGEYRYLVNILLDEPLNYLYWGETCEVNLTVETVKPISYVFG